MACIKQQIRKQLAISFVVLLANAAKAQATLIDSILKTSQGKVSEVYQQAAGYRLQIIYTQINRDSANHPTFKQIVFPQGEPAYYYCASMVKLPVSILALEKINELQIPGLSKSSFMQTDSAAPCQKAISTDSSAVNGKPSIEQYIKRMLLVSDNFSYGRVFEFLGTDYIHQRLNNLKFPDIRIIHRFDGGCTGIENQITNPLTFYNHEGRILYRQAMQTDKAIYRHPLGKVRVGKAYIDNNRRKIKNPKDFTNMNFVSLKDVHELLRRLVFMDELVEEERYHISREDRLFLLKYLSLYPRESESPVYDPKKYPDNYKKYLLYGNRREEIRDTALRIVNIVGQSYGFMSDCAYFYDTRLGIEWMLSVAVYTNKDEILNDGKYEYQTVALPFMAELGKIFYDFEQKRKRKYHPVFTGLPLK